MRKYLISTVVILIALAVAWPVLSQREGEEGKQPREGRRRFQDMSEEERAKMKERFQNMSEEERQKLLAERRGGFAGRGPMLGREEQLKAIAEIEKHLVELKKAVQTGPESADFRKLREGTPEEQAKLRESWQKARLEQQKLINGIQEQLARLGGPRPPTARTGLPIRELKEIQGLAVKENAKGTAERLEKLIAGLQKEPGQPQERGPRPQRQKQERQGQRPPSEKPQR